ncbi:MAG: polyamine aminopropyltransferase [Firmicutes bacterium]|nr:polyamine aminopropyltransferase [Bacillota bacterium]
MNLWFTEKQTPDISLSCRIRDVLLDKQSAYQKIAVIDTVSFGRMLVLDGYIQTSEGDGHIYHEMIVHVPMVTHPAPRKVLIIGGGDGGAVREALKHPHVEKVTLVEIDHEVVEACRSYLPETGNALGDGRVKICYEDGAKYLYQPEDNYDIIIIDSSEPVGPSADLFSREFYRRAYGALSEDGILVAQTESPFCNEKLITRSFTCFRELFPIAELYLASIPSYPSGLWSFMLGSRKHHPGDSRARKRAVKIAGCRYYSPEIHQSAFVLPPFVKGLLTCLQK